jgi:hypothetical protein
MARVVRKMVGIGLLAAVAYAAWRWWDSQRQSAGTDWEPQPFPYPPTPKTPADNGAQDATAETEAISPDA